MLRVGICDDDPAANARLQDLLGQYGAQRTIPLQVAAFQNGEELLAQFAEGLSFDLVILDVYMGELDGIAVAKRIRERDKLCPIVFLTNSREDAIHGYGVRALQYLIKPIEPEALTQTLDLVREELPAQGSKSVQIENRTGIYRVLLTDIVFAESRAKVVTVHTRTQGDLSFYGRLDHFAQDCDASHFFRCHKSFLVNLDFVYGIKERSFVLKTGQAVRISTNLADAKRIFAAHAARYLKP